MTIHKEYQKAGILRGHYCPGLAIGVRAAVARESEQSPVQDQGIFRNGERLRTAELAVS